MVFSEISVTGYMHESDSNKLYMHMYSTINFYNGFMIKKSPIFTVALTTNYMQVMVTCNNLSFFSKIPVIETQFISHSIASN